jgi:hypothetical protein
MFAATTLSTSMVHVRIGALHIAAKTPRLPPATITTSMVTCQTLIRTFFGLCQYNINWFDLRPQQTSHVHQRERIEATQLESTNGTCTTPTCAIYAIYASVPSIKSRYELHTGGTVD